MPLGISPEYFPPVANPRTKLLLLKIILHVD